jgi:hypothetical protein
MSAVQTVEPVNNNNSLTVTGGVVSSQKAALHKLFTKMLTKPSIDSDEYLQANISAANAISFDTIMMVSSVDVPEVN